MNKSNTKQLVYRSTGRRVKPTFSTDEQIISKYMQLFAISKREAIKKLQLLNMGIQLSAITKQFDNQ